MTEYGRCAHIIAPVSAPRLFSTGSCVCGAASGKRFVSVCVGPKFGEMKLFPQKMIG